MRDLWTENFGHILLIKAILLAIDHRIQNAGLPVRSDVLKLYAGWLVVGWVTTSESQLLIVFAIFCPNLGIECVSG